MTNAIKVELTKNMLERSVSEGALYKQDNVTIGAQNCFDGDSIMRQVGPACYKILLGPTSREELKREGQIVLEPDITIYLK